MNNESKFITQEIADNKGKVKIDPKSLLRDAVFVALMLAAGDAYFRRVNDVHSITPEGTPDPNIAKYESLQANPEMFPQYPGKEYGVSLESGGAVDVFKKNPETNKWELASKITISAQWNSGPKVLEHAIVENSTVMYRDFSTATPTSGGNIVQINMTEKSVQADLVTSPDDPPKTINYEVLFPSPANNILAANHSFVPEDYLRSGENMGKKIAKVIAENGADTVQFISGKITNSVTAGIMSKTGSVMQITKDGIQITQNGESITGNNTGITINFGN